MLSGRYNYDGYFCVWLILDLVGKKKLLIKLNILKVRGFLRLLFVFKMSEKRKRVVLTIQEKLDIIEKIEQGGSVKLISANYGIGETTARDIKRNKDKIMAYVNNSNLSVELTERKSMKLSTYKELDKALLKWYNKQRAQGNYVSGVNCAKQAKLLSNSLGMQGDFNASSGWLARFRKRYGIKKFDSAKRNVYPVGTKWIKVENKELEYVPLNTNQLVEEEHSKESNSNTETINNYISHETALDLADSLLDYLDQQEDTLPTDKLMLRKLRCTIKNKIGNTIKQEQINDYF